MRHHSYPIHGLMSPIWAGSHFDMPPVSSPSPAMMRHDYITYIYMEGCKYTISFQCMYIYIHTHIHIYIYIYIINLAVSCSIFMSVTSHIQPWRNMNSSVISFACWFPCSKIDFVGIPSRDRKQKWTGQSLRVSHLFPHSNSKCLSDHF